MIQFLVSLFFVFSLTATIFFNINASISKYNVSNSK